jgi:hypothetical protein
MTGESSSGAQVVPEQNGTACPTDIPFADHVHRSPRRGGHGDPGSGVVELNVYYVPWTRRWAAIIKALGMKAEN